MWANLTIAGFRALGASRQENAAFHWLAARDALVGCDPLDPRRLASETNAGLAHAFIGQSHEADDALTCAESGWMHLLNDVTTADIPVRVGSSAFQFKLASENIEAFRDLHRTRASELCEAALAMTRFNRLVLTTDIGPGDALIAPLSALLRTALGAHAHEVSLLQAEASTADERDALSSYAEKAAQLEARFARLAANWPVDTWQSLGHAVSFTALLHPGFRTGNPARESPFKMLPEQRKPLRSSTT